MIQLKNLALLVFLLVFSIANAQEFQGRAIYQSITSITNTKNSITTNKDFTPQMQKIIEARMRKMNEKTFVLNFDKTNSIYEEEEKLTSFGDKEEMGRVVVSSESSDVDGKYYKNIKDKIVIIQKELLGKEFLIKDSLPKLKWKLNSESKIIGSYTCYKATLDYVVNKSDFKNLILKLKKDIKGTTNIMDYEEIEKGVKVTAWYTDEIPIGQGPENYWGLPGLILEVNSGKTTILCSKIILNPKDRKEIIKPKRGKSVTQKELDKIIFKKLQEFQ